MKTLTILDAERTELLPVMNEETGEEVDKAIPFEGGILVLSDFSRIDPKEKELTIIGQYIIRALNGCTYILSTFDGSDQALIFNVEVAEELYTPPQQQYSRYTL